ncbi:MAG: hypothetical protein PHE55_13915 [Methylococcaceae bacterium]|nr:hypothetical protein [Methylococcaceae bacterium]
MNNLVTQLIHACNGYHYESVGIISAFFNDPYQAQDCARQIRSRVDSIVEVCGCQLAVWL